MTKEELFDQLAERVADNVGWQRSTGYEWECDACIGHEFLADLLRLAIKAPPRDVQAFIDNM